MPTITAEVSGLPEWRRALQHKLGQVEHATHFAARKSMARIEKAVKIKLRTYTHERGTATPSPPGEPPALVSGNLMRSWHNRGPRPGRRAHTVEMEGGPTERYARIQELGGRTGRNGRTRLPRRPYVRPVVEGMRREIRVIFRDEWIGALAK